jgi:hypothetical protein
MRICSTAQPTAQIHTEGDSADAGSPTIVTLWFHHAGNNEDILKLLQLSLAADHARFTPSTPLSGRRVFRAFYLVGLNGLSKL